MIIDNTHIRKIEGTWILPSSKSLSHRYLIAQALSKSDFHLQNVSESSDTQILIENLNNKEDSFYFFKDAGTPSRLFIAYAALLGLNGVIDANLELRKRPFRPLFEALQNLGAEFVFIENEYCLPLKVIKSVNLNKKEVSVDNTMSSQFVSALMMIAPFFNEGLTIRMADNLTSLSYIKMTKDVMVNCGIKVKLENNILLIENGNYHLPLNTHIESDWSAASYPLMFAEVLNEANLFLPHLALNSVQGDKKIQNFLNNIEFVEENNGLRVIKNQKKISKISQYDVIDCPDLFPALIAIMTFKKERFKISGIKNLKFKESDRVLSMKNNLNGIVEFQMNDNEISAFEFFKFEKEILRINSYKDHRIAMAMSLFSLKYKLETDDIEVVNKSFPKYWEKLKQVLH